MAPLIVAVKSTFEDLQAGEHDRVRSTWGAGFRGKALLKFFISRQTHRQGMFNTLPSNESNSYTPKSDEYILDVPDERNSMVKKVRGICKYVVDKVCSHVLIVDVLHNVDVRAAMEAPYEFADYAGDFSPRYPGEAPEPVTFFDQDKMPVVVEQCYSWARSDAGYYLSRKATAELSFNTPSVSQYVVGSQDDVWVGQVLGPDIVNGDLIGSQLESVTDSI